MGVCLKNDIFYMLAETDYDFVKTAGQLKELNSLKGISQNPDYHGEGDVWNHTGMVCEALKELPEWAVLEDRMKGILFLAACFHDYGKIKCTKMEDGRIISPGHTVTGARMVRELFYRQYSDVYDISFEKREAVVWLVRYHGLPPLFMEKQDVDRQLCRIRETVDFSLLYLLSKADVMGRYSTDREQYLSMVEYFREYSGEIGCFESKPVFANEHTRHRYYQGSNVWRSDCLFDDTKFPVYVMAGLPLAGKDTYIQKYFPSLPVVSLDDIREEWGLGGGDMPQAVAAEARERAKQFLRREEAFVWDATNITRDLRGKILTLCQRYGARVTMIYVEVPYKELLVRNKTRARTVPVEVIDRMLKKMDMVEPSESYRVIYEVSV